MHDRARNKLSSVSERTSPVTVHRTAPVVSHLVARLFIYAAVNGTYIVRSLCVPAAKALLHLFGRNLPWLTPLATKGAGLPMSLMVLGDNLFEHQVVRVHLLLKSHGLMVITHMHHVARSAAYWLSN